jgi:hypothetical protein
MKRILKIVLVIFLILLTIPAAVLFYLSRVHHQSVHDELVNYINREFDGQVTFQDFSFSYIKYFPKAHIGLRGVAVLDDGKEIIKIGKVNISINTRALWRKEIELHELIIRDADFFSIIDSLGNKPKILAGNSQKSDSIHKSLLIQADNIGLFNANLYFENQIKNNRTGIHVYDAKLDLITEGDQLIFKGELNGHLDSLVSNNTVLFANQPVRAQDVVFSVDEKNGKKELLEGYIMAHSVRLVPRLSMEPFEDGQNVELHILSEDNFDALLGLFEFHTGIEIQQVNPDAQLKISYNQVGFVNPFLRPYSELDFEISAAKFEGYDLPYPLDIIKIIGNYNNGEEHSPKSVELVIDTIVAEVKESFVYASLELTNLNDPFINAHFRSSISLDHLFHQDKNMKLSGIIEADLAINGKISELKSLHLDGKQHAKGNIQVKDLELVLNDQGYTIEMSSGSTLLDNHILEVTSLVGAFNQSAFHFQGMFENLDRLILQDSEQLIGSFNLEFDELDLRKFKIENKNPQKDTSAGMPSFFGNRIELQVKGNKVITGVGDLENIRLKALLDNEALKLPLLSFDFMEGSIDGNADLVFSGNNISKINTLLNLEFKHLVVDSLLGQAKKTGKKDTAQTIPAIPFALDARLNFKADEITYRDASLTGTHTQIHLTNSDLRITDLYAGLPFGELKMDLIIPDYSTDKVAYKGQIDLNIDSLAIDRFLEMRVFGLPDIGNKPKEARKNKFSLPENIDVKFSMQADYLAYKNAAIDDVNFDVHYLPDKIDLKDLEFNFANGHVQVNGFINKDQDQPYPGYAYSKADSIDLILFLKAFDNFGQDVFTYENTSGKVSWSSHYYFGLHKQFALNMDENLVLLNTIIHDAALNQVEPVEKTLFFVGHKSKDHMIIEDLRTNVFLYRNKLYIPDLLMNDNIANLDAYGILGLDDKTMDLSLEISLSDLFFRTKKNRLVQTQEGTVNLEKDAKLFLQLDGPINDHKMKLVSKRKFDKHRKDMLDEIRLAETAFKKKHEGE